MPGDTVISTSKALTAAFMADPKEWPQDPVCMKTLPWLPGEQRFGLLSSRDPKRVMVDGGGFEDFPSVDAMLDVWTVD